jgi:hypothetical protein
LRARSKRQAFDAWPEVDQDQRARFASRFTSAFAGEGHDPVGLPWVEHVDKSTVMHLPATQDEVASVKLVYEGERVILA